MHKFHKFNFQSFNFLNCTFTITSSAEGIGDTQGILSTMIAVYIVVMMLRFFKAFRANPRLNVVAQTMVDGATDIVHFFVVFILIFVAFSVAGQVMFGTKMRDFSSISKSMNMG
jgi:hypothetical protein